MYRVRWSITGFTGMGIDGIGWGTSVTLDKVWVTGFNGAIGLRLRPVRIS